MPIPIPVLGTTPPAGPPAVVDLPLPVVVLTASDGEHIVCGAQGEYVLMPGARGFGLAPVNLFSDANPSGDGATFRALQVTERDVFLPILLNGTDYANLRDLRRTVERILDPERGAVTVTVAQPDGERLSATGVYSGGAEGSYGVDEFGASWQILGIVIRCHDPSWYGDPMTLEFRTAATAKPFLSATEPFFPIELAPSQVIGEVVIDNPGDKPAFPVWEVLGPGSDFEATNVTTGAVFTVSGTIDTDEAVIVDTRHGQQDVRGADNANLWSRLSDDGELWPLRPGPQDVTLALTGATAESLVRVTFRPRMRSAL